MIASCDFAQFVAGMVSEGSFYLQQEASAHGANYLVAGVGMGAVGIPWALQGANLREAVLKMDKVDLTDGGPVCSRSDDS